jgi:hypothetical protein
MRQGRSDSHHDRRGQRDHLPCPRLKAPLLDNAVERVTERAHTEGRSHEELLAPALQCEAVTSLPGPPGP